MNLSDQKSRRIPQAEFVPERLAQARNARAWTMTELAQQVDLSRQAISQFERGIARPSPSNLRLLADCLGMPTAYFTWDLTETERQKETPASFRSLVSSKAKARRQAEAWLEWNAAIYDVLSQFVRLAPADLPKVDGNDIWSFDQAAIEDLATQTRRNLGLGDGPISNLTLLLENHGVYISFRSLSADLSGLSQWYGGRPFVLIDPKKSAVRTRFSLAHELGHLVLHRDYLSVESLADSKTLKTIEKQADLFASAFLLPEGSFGSEVYGFDWDAMLELKMRWKVSIAAITMRLHYLELISHWQKVRMFQRLSARNARVHEPLDDEIPQDYPRLASRIMDAISMNDILPIHELPNLIRLGVERIAEFTRVDREKLLAEEGAFENVIFLQDSGRGA